MDEGVAADVTVVDVLGDVAESAGKGLVAHVPSLISALCSVCARELSLVFALQLAQMLGLGAQRMHTRSTRDEHHEHGAERASRPPRGPVEITLQCTWCFDFPLHPFA